MKAYVWIVCIPLNGVIVFVKTCTNMSVRHTHTHTYTQALCVECVLDCHQSLVSSVEFLRLQDYFFLRHFSLCYVSRNRLNNLGVCLWKHGACFKLQPETWM